MFSRPEKSGPTLEKNRRERPSVWIMCSMRRRVLPATASRRAGCCDMAVRRRSTQRLWTLDSGAQAAHGSPVIDAPFFRGALVRRWEYQDVDIISYDTISGDRVSIDRRMNERRMNAGQVVWRGVPMTPGPSCMHRYLTDAGRRRCRRLGPTTGARIQCG